MIFECSGHSYDVYLFDNRRPRLLLVLPLHLHCYARRVIGKADEDGARDGVPYPLNYDLVHLTHLISTRQDNQQVVQANEYLSR